ncbi:hypothetical protein AB0904_09975 [Streptomyces sp. NPDC006684]
MARIVVAVEPASGNTAVSEGSGLVVAARDYDGHPYVLDDRSGSMGAND